MGEYGPTEFQAALGVSHETIERLDMHRQLLGQWSARMNLIGPKELDLYWRRHALDCAQLLAHAPGARTWIDLGAGAGFPGIVIACLLTGQAGALVHLVESTGKKASFLRAVIEQAELPAKVFNQRIEDFGAGEGRYDVVTARALAPLPRLIAYAKPMLDQGALGLFLKGADTAAEIAAASGALAAGGFRAEALESVSDPRGRIVRVSKAG